ncbi:MAG: hypothetical protein LBI84_09155, partial [Propionibacteriaceae bacterium]|nr:hypothetical protein [Propionibacteriaceae bacterium]
MTAPAVPAPQPPGALDRLADPVHILSFLNQLGDWLDDRRQRLDALDQALLSRPGPAERTGDLVVALALWKSIQNRYGSLLRTWDSGRVGPVQLRQLAQLMWGRLDEERPAERAPEAMSPAAPPAAAGMSVNLPEACRLFDALAAQLSAQLRLTGQEAQSALRLTGLRAQAERLRDQVRLEPAGRREALAKTVAGVAADVAELTAKADRGGDIGGLLGPLEIKAARLERDLIVGNAQRRQAEAAAAELGRLRGSLEERAGAAARLVQEARRRVLPAPKYAVPHISALGPVPADAAQFEDYGNRLAQVGRALAVVEQANQAALAAL